MQDKINKLLSLSDEFLFVEYFPHTNKYMWKIKNVFTLWSASVVVLYPTDEPFEKSLDTAIEYIEKAKKEFIG